MGIALVYCAAGGKGYRAIAAACGWLNGARLPGTVHGRLDFADQDWKKADRSAYMAALARYRPVHLLGGSPQAQLRLRPYLNVVGADGNMVRQQADRCRFWVGKPFPPGYQRWTQLGAVGDDRSEGANLECFQRSLLAIRAAWESASGESTHVRT